MGLGLGLGSCSGALSRARTAPAVSSAAGEGDLQRPVALDHKLRLARDPCALGMHGDRRDVLRRDHQTI